MHMHTRLWWVELIFDSKENTSDLTPTYFIKYSDASGAGGSDVTTESLLGRSTLLWWILVCSASIWRKKLYQWIIYHSTNNCAHWSIVHKHRQIIPNVVTCFVLEDYVPRHVISPWFSIFGKSKLENKYLYLYFMSFKFQNSGGRCDIQVQARYFLFSTWFAVCIQEGQDPYVSEVAHYLNCPVPLTRSSLAFIVDSL